MRKDEVDNINNNDSYSIELYGNNTLNGVVYDVQQSEREGTTFTKITFNEYVKHKLTETRINVVLSNVSLKTVVKNIIQLAGIPYNSNTVGGSSTVVTEISLSGKSADDCLEELSDKYNYLYFVKNGTVVFKNTSPYSATSTTSYISPDRILSRNKVKSGENYAVYLRLKLQVHVSAGDTITIRQSSESFLAHTVIHKQESKVITTEVYLVDTSLSPTVLKGMYFHQASAVYDGIKQTIKGEIAKSTAFEIGKISRYTGSDFRVNSNVGQEDVEGKRKSVDIDISGSQEVTDRPVLVPIAINKGGFIIPAYIGERNVFFRFDDQDTIIGGKLYGSGTELPPNEPGDYSRFLPITETNTQWDELEANVLVIDKDGNEMRRVFSLFIDATTTALARPTAVPAGEIHFKSNRATIEDLMRLVPRIQPPSGQQGDIYFDSGVNLLRMCVAGGTPGTWVSIDVAGALANHGNAFHTPDFIAVDGSAPPTTNIPWGSNKITSLADPDDNQDAATKKYVDDNDVLTNHNDLPGLNAGDSYEHITQTQKDALHAEVHDLDSHSDISGDLATTIKSLDDYASSFPGSPVEGQMHWDTDDESWYRYSSVAQAWIEVAGSGGLNFGQIATLSVIDIDFTASDEEDKTITIDTEMREVIRGRIWIDADPGADFSKLIDLTFYNKSQMRGEDAIFRVRGKLVYTELDTATSTSDANIIPDEHIEFSPWDLVRFLDDDECQRLETVASTMVAEDNNQTIHPINTGLSRVMEINGFSLWNNESGSSVYLRIAFAAAQTVSLKLELMVRKLW